MFGFNMPFPLAAVSTSWSGSAWYSQHWSLEKVFCGNWEGTRRGIAPTGRVVVMLLLRNKHKTKIFNFSTLV